MTDHLDVILRVYDLAELPLLRTCVFTLLGQNRPALPVVLRINLMTERLTSGEAQELRAGLADLLDLDDTVRLVLRNWDFRAPFDLRVPLLNLALDVTTGRYLSVLDSNDLLLPGALATLLHRLDQTGAAAAVGGLQEQRVRWEGDVFLPLAPPTAPQAGHDATWVLLDRTRLDKTSRFQAVDDATAMADFLARLRPGQAVDDACAARALCIRQDFRAITPRPPAEVGSEAKSNTA